MVGEGRGWLCDAPPVREAPTTSRDATESVPFDAHGIGPIPVGSRDSTPWEQFWIWAGANIAPIIWVLGAFGITLGLSLVETLVVVSLGNVVGCAVFGLFNVIGHRTAPRRSPSLACLRVFLSASYVLTRLITWIPAPAKTASNMVVNVVSRSRMRNREVVRASSRSIVRLRAVRSARARSGGR